MDKELCGAWMPRAKETCALTKGHKDSRHRPAKWVVSFREYKKAWKDENADKVKADRAAHYQANKEKVIRQTNEYRGANRERLLAASKRWRDSNPDKQRSYERKYIDKNPDAYREKGRLKETRRRARKAGVPCEYYTREDVLRAWGPICYLCDSIIPDDWHLEHVIPLSRGGHDTVGNVRPACPSCNLAKGDKTVEEYVAWLKALAAM